MTGVQDLSELAKAAAARWPEKAALLHPSGDVALTYRELDALSDSFAQHILAQELAPGSPVLLLHNNTPDFFATFFGTIRAGMVAVPLDAQLAGPELVKIIAHAAPAALVADDSNLEKIRGLNAGVPVHTVGEHEAPGVTRWARQLPLATRALPRLVPDALALMLYTSGTTGTPKGVMHSHRTVISNLDRIREVFAMREDYVALCLLPTHFGHGLICNCLATFNYGGTLTLCRPFDLPLVSRLWEVIEVCKVNLFSSVPAVVRLLLRVAERQDRAKLRSLEFVTCASAPLRAEDASAFTAKLGVPLLNCYGITETASWTAYSPRSNERDLDSVGLPGPGCEIAAFDPGGKRLPPGSEGELRVRSPSVMLGYYRAPELTAAAIQDGWFCTGDLGKVDAQGRVFILGRIKELIIRAGLNIYPAEVDAALCAHPEVHEAFSTSLEDPLLGEKVVAVVVRKPDGAVTEKELIAFCRGQLAAYKCPERICFVEAVPKTSRGKVNRANLRPLFARG